MHTKILLLCVLFTQSLAVWDGTSSANYDDPELVLIHQTQGSHHFPSSLQLSFNYGYSRVVFDVTRDDAMTRFLSPSIVEQSSFLPSNLVTNDNTEDLAVYHNQEPVNSEDRVNLVLQRDTVNQSCKVYGSFFKDGDKLFISPVENSVNEHRIRRASAVRTKRVSGSENVIEIGVHVSSAVSNKIGTSGGNFARSLIRDLDVIFRGVTTTSVRAYVAFTSYSSTEQFFVTDNLINGNTQLDGTPATTDFIAFLTAAQTTVGLPTYDHVIGLVDYPLVVSGVEEPFVTSGTICTDGLDSASLVYFEQAHYLKAVGQAVMTSMGVSKAVGSNLFLMSNDFTSVPTIANADQPWKMKGNKQSELAAIISTLESGSNNCLRTFDPSFDFQSFMRTSTMGRSYTVNEQCQNIYGTSFCGGSITQNICYEGVFCTNPDTSACDARLYVGDLTTCDTEMFCRYGTCSASVTTTTSTTVSTPQPTTEEPLRCNKVQKERIKFDFNKIRCNGVTV